MRLTRKADYGLRALYYIACQPSERFVPVEEIGRTQHIPEGFLAKVLNELVRGGLLASRRGQDGGLRLARPASKITLLDILRVLEGPLAINECLTPRPSCRWVSTCPMRVVWKNLQETIESRLSGVNLARMARQELVPGRTTSRS
jgi:Rrf2 family protein